MSLKNILYGIRERRIRRELETPPTSEQILSVASGNFARYLQGKYIEEGMKEIESNEE